MELQTDTTSQIKKNVFLVAILMLTVIATILGVRFWLHAQASKIPSGYTVLSYINALEEADKNHDGYINGLDGAALLKRYGQARMMIDPKFGTKFDSREMSFVIAHFNGNVAAIKTELLSDPGTSVQNVQDIVVANELTLPPPAYLNDDTEFNARFPNPIPPGKITLPIQPIITSQNLIAKNTSDINVLGESTDNADTRAGGQGTGSKGADSGRTIIPSVLGTVSAYTGEAGFDYPISAPSGPGGITPSVSLSYSSGNVDDVLPYDDRYVDDIDDNGQEVHDYYYRNIKSYTPSYSGYGFSVNGGGSIVRDTRQEKDVYVLKGDIHHRFILNLPSGLSVQLLYNKATRGWTSIPEGFVKVDHVPPAPSSANSTTSYIDGKMMPGSDFKLVDADQWVITASDGSKYYFGEEDLVSKLTEKGQIKASTNLTIETTKKIHCNPGPCEKVPVTAVHHAITEHGGIYNEFDIVDLCNGLSANTPCEDAQDSQGHRVPGRLTKDKPVLLTTKWLLRRMETSDGKAIHYSYDNYQKSYDGNYYRHDWDNQLSFATVDSYLRQITWNDDKHRILLYREARGTDTGGKQFIATQRLSRVDVETKLQSDNAYHLVHRYQLSYANDDSVMADNGGKNDWQISLLRSIQEFGTDGKITTPAISFKYKQYGFDKGPSGSTIYLTSINNGYGGETQYAYEPFNYILLNGSGDPASGPRRVRVVEKKVVDKTANPVAASKETYDYKDYRDKQNCPQGCDTAIGFADRIRGKEISGREFLGHRIVDIKTYDFNSDKLLAHANTEFNQFKGDWSEHKRTKYNCDEHHNCQVRDAPGWTCFEPHLSRGRAKREIIYNQLPSGAEIEAKKTETNYNYRILDWDSSGKGYIKEDNINTDSKTCAGTGMIQPYFVYTKDTTVTSNEPVNNDFAKKGLLTNLKETPVNTRTVKSENIQYDLFGNLLKSVSLGPVNDKGENLKREDDRYTYGFYLTGNPNWLNNLPYLSYSSNSDNCVPDPKNLKCQYGTSKIWYDQFYGDFFKVDPSTQTPKLGLVTQTASYLDTDSNGDGTHDDPVVTYHGTEYLRLSNDPRDNDPDPNNDTTDARRGGQIRAYGPKPNVKNITIDEIPEKIKLLSQTEYDPYYKTLVISTQNALGHKNLLEDYDYLLQMPRRSATQISRNPDIFSAARVEFDALGRVIASFGPDPSDPSKILSFPQSINAYFDDRGDSGLATRQMSVVSQTKDGIFHYMAADSFYDGLGKVKQTQTLSKKVEGVEKRLVNDAVYNALGQQPEAFESQVTDPVILPAVDATNYKDVIRTSPPQMTTIDHKVLSKSVTDGLNRPIEATTFDVDNNFALTTKTYYYVNAQKTVNPKGVASITTSDTLGRTVDALIIDPQSDNNTITQNEYAQDMIDKPTLTTYRSIKELPGGSSATTKVTYDKSGRIITSDEPSLGKGYFEYDVNGNILLDRRTDRADNTHEYDILGRLVKTKYFNPNSEELYKGIMIEDADVTYTYDAALDALGKLVSVGHSTGKDEFTYDQAGRQETVKKTIKEKTYSTTNHYNTLSQVVGVDYPDDQKYAMEYDDEGVTQKTYLNGQQLAASTIFDKFGRSKESQFILGANTYVSKTAYDTMGRLTELRFTKKDGADYFKQQLQYDQFAQLSPLTESTFKDGQEDKTTYNYTYDSFARLTKAESSKFNTSYSYDPFGRLQTKNEQEPITLAYDSTFPFFAPKAITRPPEPPSPTPVKPSPSPTPMWPPRISPPIDNTQPTEAIEPTATPTRSPSVTPTPFTASPTPVAPTPTPAGCFFEPIIAIKERMADGTLRPLTTDEAKDFLTLNNKRKAKYDPDGTKREFWNKFTDGYFKPYPDGGGDYLRYQGPNPLHHGYCCVDETNYDEATQTGYGYYINNAIDEALITLKYFGTGSSKFEVVDKFCHNKEGSTGCPPDTRDQGGLRQPDVPVTQIPHLQVGCNRRYEYGWIVVRNSALGSLLKKLFPAGRGLAEDRGTPVRGGGTAFNFNYNDKGAMLEDDKQCYSYNRLNQLTSMKIKKNKGQSCTSGEFTKSIYFYYDYAGTLVLQEEYKGTSNKPAKQTYYFGSYEDEYSSE